MDSVFNQKGYRKLHSLWVDRMFSNQYWMTRFSFIWNGNRKIVCFYLWTKTPVNLLSCTCDETDRSTLVDCYLRASYCVLSSWDSLMPCGEYRTILKRNSFTRRKSFKKYVIHCSIGCTCYFCLLSSKGHLSVHRIPVMSIEPL